jgi:hypothetical protein
MGKVSSAPQSRQNQIRIEFPAAIPGMSICRITSFVFLLLCAGCTGISTKTPSPLPAAQTPQITTSVLANAQTGIQLQTSITATGGLQPYRWSVASGTLPSGISLDAASGMLSGKPTLGGQFNFSVMLSDSSAPKPQTAMKALTLAVLAFALQITPGSLPNGQVGVPFQATITGDGGVTPYTWAVTGALPAGLSLTASSGGIAGTPTQAGSSAFTIVLTDSMGQTAQNASSITIAAAGSTGSGPVVITPSTPPAVNQGGAFQFTANAPVTWSMAAGGQGTIDADGTYHAPASVKAQQSYGGYQVLPNNHIFNTRIDSLPVHQNSAIWISGAGAVPVSYHEISFPINYVNAATPTQNTVFLYTPGNSGPFQIPQYPNAAIEHGWFTPPFAGDDRHLLAIDTTNGTFQEMYNFYAAGAKSGCPTCTSASGIRYSNSTYNLPNSQGGGVDAAGLYVMPLMLRLQEMEQAVAAGGTIKHALRMTLQNGYICGSNTAGACGPGQAAGTRHIWPATAEAFAGGGVVPYGARFRLKAGFDTSKFSAIAQILLTQLKQYGLILADGGTGWATQPEYTKWPAAYRAAFDEISGAGIGPSNFEAVDESGLEISPTSGLTPAGETVIATDVTNPANTARQQVVLTGVTITIPKDTLSIQAGTPAQQLNAFIHGTSNTNMTWTMSPIIGTLTSGGLYTPPSSIGAATVATVTATSVADASVAATMTLTVLPAGTIRLVLGQPRPYTDTNGNVWQNEVGDDGCHSYDNGGTFPNVPDITLYRITCFSDNDIRFDITVPNGNYQITAKFAETETVAVGDRLMDLEANGIVVNSNVDIYALAGSMNNTPVDFVIPATVTNGQLSFVVRHVKGDFSIISALQIAPSR